VSAGGESFIRRSRARYWLHSCEHGERAGDSAAGSRRALPRGTRAVVSAQRTTDKRPDNFLYLGLIKRLFPAARIINTTRPARQLPVGGFFILVTA
jgi:hypothetical protein